MSSAFSFTIYFLEESMPDIEIILVVIFAFVAGLGIGYEIYQIFFDRPANAYLNIIHDPDEEKPYMMLDITSDELKNIDKREDIKLRIRHIDMRE